MPIKDMPKFVFAHKNIRNAVIYSLVTCFVLLLEFIFMKHSALNVFFDVIIPFSAAVTFGCNAITMTLDRPVILICPTTCYFVSLLINQLIAVEVGTEYTYPFIILIELVPYIMFCISVATGTIKKATDITLKVYCILIAITCVVIAILARFFHVKIFSFDSFYAANITAMITGFVAVVFTYLTMIECLKTSGQEKRVHKKINFRKELTVSKRG